MRSKLVFTVLLSLFLSSKGSAQLIPVTRDSLLQLVRPDDPLNYYVNFDFIKFSIPGLSNGWSLDSRSVNNNIPGKYAPCFNFQFYWPKALFSHKRWLIHIAYGISIGYNSMDWMYTQLNLPGNNIATLTDNNRVKREVLKTGYIGVNLMPFMQMGRKKRFELMTGPSLQFNALGRKLVTRGHDGTSKLHHIGDVNYISLPLITQLDYKFERTKILFIGVYYSYDLIARFTDPAMNEVRQIVAGINFGFDI